MSEIGFDRVLLDASRVQANRLAELESENTELRHANTRLKVTVANLRRRIYQARYAHARWLLRQQSWRHERDELLRSLARLDPSPHPAVKAYRDWGPGS